MAESTPAPEPAVSAHRPADRPDLRIQFETARFKYRVSAFVHDGGRLLTCRREGADYCYVPGGKVALGESSEEAMHRELREELGIDLGIGPLMVVLEEIYTYREEFRHDLNFCFPADVPAGMDPDELTRNPEEGHVLEWVPFGELAAAGFRPAGFTADVEGLLKTAGGPPRHMVLRDSA
jgi:8-oxo-dGTP pyrophosphatase MutT (NUDIX family)